MRRMFLLLSALTLFATPAFAGARTYFGFTIGVTNAPPPPRMVVVEEEPHLCYVPESRVYAVDDDDYDYDQFHSDNYWYVCNEGYWYRAHKHRGPYRAIDVRHVPRRVLMVPDRHWRHRSHHFDDRRQVAEREHRGKHEKHHKHFKDHGHEAWNDD